METARSSLRVVGVFRGAWMDDGVFYDLDRIGEMPVVSPIQLYLDLNVLGDRGKEAADFIFKQVIEPRWKKKKALPKPLNRTPGKRV